MFLLPSRIDSYIFTNAARHKHFKKHHSGGMNYQITATLHNFTQMLVPIGGALFFFDCSASIPAHQHSQAQPFQKATQREHELQKREIPQVHKKACSNWRTTVFLLLVHISTSPPMQPGTNMFEGTTARA